MTTVILNLNLSLLGIWARPGPSPARRPSAEKDKDKDPVALTPPAQQVRPFQTEYHPLGMLWARPGISDPTLLCPIQNGVFEFLEFSGPGLIVFKSLLWCTFLFLVMQGLRSRRWHNRRAYWRPNTICGSPRVRQRVRWRVALGGDFLPISACPTVNSWVWKLLSNWQNPQKNFTNKFKYLLKLRSFGRKHLQTHTHRAPIFFRLISDAIQ